MIAYIVTAAISVSAGVLGMGIWCGLRDYAAEIERDKAEELRDMALERMDDAFRDYVDERRKRLEAEQAHAALADKHNLALAKLEAIRNIPNNGKKPNGGLAKAQRIAGKV